MMHNEILNHMDTDELRAYCCHLGQLEERQGELNYANSEVIDILKRLVNELTCRNDCKERYVCAQGTVRLYEREMERRYEEYMPRPVCDTER